MNQFQVFILYEFVKEVQRNYPKKKYGSLKIILCAILQLGV